ncbi:MAG: hypothetical protein HYS26_02435 [Candidatus Kaiserbacteria bacterium]|nr:MAG: hypothetical protein HYS26_02435 [Candidatus Kaiserbacteria bacterium]
MVKDSFDPGKNVIKGPWKQRSPDSSGVKRDNEGYDRYPTEKEFLAHVKKMYEFIGSLHDKNGDPLVISETDIQQRAVGLKVYEIADLRNMILISEEHVWQQHPTYYVAIARVLHDKINETRERAENPPTDDVD